MNISFHYPDIRKDTFKSCKLYSQLLAQDAGDVLLSGKEL